MLNESRVLDYVKNNMGWPNIQIEMSDTDILTYVKEYTIREFSLYIPEVNTITLNITDPNIKVPNRANEFYINDPDGREILNVKNLYMGMSDMMYFGHPPFGPLNQCELRNWALNVEVAGMLRLHSSFYYTHAFRHPNIVRISPNPTSHQGTIAVEYERMQSDDFSGIPNDLQILFMDLALADIMENLGQARKKYGNGVLRSPFGEIPLDTDILEAGKQMKSEIIQKLEMKALPNITIDFG